MAHRALFVVALAGLMALVTSSTAVAAIVPVLITGPSPYAGCAPADNTLTGRTFPNAEVEPQVAVSGSTAIAMWHQDRRSNGGARGIGVGFSSTGGASWTETTIPLTACSPNTQAALSGMFRASDPWVSIGPDGIAYASALSFNLGGVPNNANAVVAARSTDGGMTWDHITPIRGGFFDTAQNSTDKNSTTADPTRNKTAYTVWDTLVAPTDNPDDNPHAAAYTGPAFFSKTTDGGKTWSQAQIIVNTGNRQQTIGNIVVVDPRNDTLYDFTDLILPPNTPFQGARSNAQLAFVKSTDGGTTWTQPQIVAPFDSVGVVDPNTGKPARVGDGLEEVAVDPSSGKLYVVYESSTMFTKNLKQSSGTWDDEILLVTSSDGGSTWTGPSVIHKLANDMPTFTPTVAVNGGRVAVTYYDSRNLQPGETANWPTDYWVEYSTDGGATFGNEQHVVGSFDLSTAPVARGFFLGDYEGLQPSGSGFLAVFAKTTCDAPYTDANACAPASSNVTPTTNTNPNDIFSAALP